MGGGGASGNARKTLNERLCLVWEKKRFSHSTADIIIYVKLGVIRFPLSSAYGRHLVTEKPWSVVWSSVIHLSTPVRNALQCSRFVLSEDDGVADHRVESIMRSSSRQRIPSLIHHATDLPHCSVYPLAGRASLHLSAGQIPCRLHT